MSGGKSYLLHNPPLPLSNLLLNLTSNHPALSPCPGCPSPEYNPCRVAASGWVRGGKRRGHVAVSQKGFRPPPSTHPPTQVSCRDKHVLFLILNTTQKTHCSILFSFLQFARREYCGPGYAVVCTGYSRRLWGWSPHL